MGCAGIIDFRATPVAELVGRVLALFDGNATPVTDDISFAIGRTGRVVNKYRGLGYEYTD